MNKVEINIPPQYADILLKTAEIEETSADEIAERAIRTFLERSSDNVR